jgi:hypothetical protein
VVQRGNQIRKSVSVHNDGTKPVKLLYATADLAGCIARVPQEAIPAGGLARISLDLTPTERWAHAASGSINVQTNVPAQPTLQLGMRYRLQSR